MKTNSKNTVNLMLTGLILVATVMAQAQESVRAKPIRYAKGTLTITSFTEKTDSSGRYQMKSKEVCTKNVQVPVFGLRSRISLDLGSDTIVAGCESSFEGFKVKVGAMAYILEGRTEGSGKPSENLIFKTVKSFGAGLFVLPGFIDFETMKSNENIPQEEVAKFSKIGKLIQKSVMSNVAIYDENTKNVGFSLSPSDQECDGGDWNACRAREKFSAQLLIQDN